MTHQQRLSVRNEHPIFRQPAIPILLEKLIFYVLGGAVYYAYQDIHPSSHPIIFRN
jgi:hypothetical protein